MVPLSPAYRAGVGALVGLAAIVLFLAHARLNSMWGTAADLQWPLDGARKLLAGSTPYTTTAYNPYLRVEDSAVLFYPLPALLVLAPLAGVPVMLAATLFLFVSTALAAYYLSAEGWSHLLVCASAPFAFAVIFAQWSPLLLLVALVPNAGWLATCKPNIGLAMLAYRPTWHGVIGCAIVVLISLLVRPTWPLELWALRLAPQYRVATSLWQVGGPLLLCAALRWRQPEGRLLLALSLLPVNLWFYDQLALGLIARTHRGRLIWAIVSWIALIAYAAVRPFGIPAYYVVVAGLYLPALALLWFDGRLVERTAR